MAIFHLAAKIHQRSKGHSAIAGAAYQSRDQLIDERTGLEHNYARKSREVLFAGIFTPKDAPDWTRDRAQLWNHVEAFEKRKDAQLARAFDIALPHELTLEQNRYALQDWVKENFTRKGLIADVAIHAPHQEGDERNIHAHVMVCMRKLDGTEFAAKKERTEDRAADLDGLRESWAKIGNRHLERHGFEATLDHRSYKDQGISQEPTIHVGKAANAMERDGMPSDRGDINRDIAADNERRVIDLAGERKRRENEKQTAPLSAVNDLAPPALAAPGQPLAGRALPQTNSTDKKMAIEREDATDPHVIKKQIEDQQDLAGKIDRLQQSNLSERFVASLQSDHDEQEGRKALGRSSFNDDITDARGRYLEASEYFDIRRPYASLSEMAGIEGATFQREQEQLKQAAAKEEDPDKRELIDLRREIEANDYMQITSQRLSEMSKIITGNSNSEESQRQAARAEYFAEQASELRLERQQLQEKINGRGLEQPAQEAAEGKWRVIDKDEVLQPGAHVRMNLSQGRSEVFEAVETPATADRADAAQPWMSQKGGVEQLSDKHLESAKANFEVWAEKNPEPAEKYGFASYVGYVQNKWAKDNLPEAAPEPTSTAADREPAASPTSQVVYLEPTVPQRDSDRASTVENTDARQNSAADNAEVTDSKAAAKAAIAQMREEIENSIANAPQRGYDNSR